MIDETKRAFLVMYDYGSGGLWGVMLARSPDEIKRVYPELEIVPDQPAWMTSEYFDELADTPYELDGAPWGLLNALLADRNRP